MKNRKKRTQIEQEKRNALYHKVIIHNQELAQKNTELSQYLHKYQNCINRLNERKWWQFWKFFKKPITI